MKRTLLALGALVLLGLAFSAQAKDYSVLDRYKLISDKLMTDRMINGFSHEFFLDIQAALSKDVTTLIDDIKEVTDTTKNATNAAQLAAADVLLQKYNKTEQFGDFSLNIGIPIFSFNIRGIGISPDLRIRTDVSTLMGISSAPITDYSEFVPADVPKELRETITKLGTLVANDDIAAKVVAYAVANPGDAVAQLASVEAAKNLGKWVIPNLNDPTAFIYAKADAKVGPHFGIKVNENWSGEFDLYGLGRSDKRIRVTGTSMVNDPDSAKKLLGKDLNTQVTINVDAKVNFNYERYNAFFLVEELKLARLSENLDKAGDLIYGYKPVMRFHANAKFTGDPWSWVSGSLVPFVGTHKRSGYDFADGFYGGVDAIGSLFKDALKAHMRFMADNYYYTINPGLKIWLLVLEYELKAPVTSKKDTIKVSTLHAAELKLRVAF